MFAGIIAVMMVQRPIPVLRIFEAALAKQFYIDW
jgi:hypothetical protein